MAAKTNTQPQEKLLIWDTVLLPNSYRNLSNFLCWTCWLFQTDVATQKVGQLIWRRKLLTVEMVTCAWQQAYRMYIYKTLPH